MSTPPPNPPESKNSLSNALIWAVLATAAAVFLFVYANRVDPEKKNFYLIVGGISALAAVINGYSAWTLYNKSRQPPASS